MVVWKPDRIRPVYDPKCPVFKWTAKSCDFTIWIPDTHSVRYSGVWYSDGYWNMFIELTFSSHSVNFRLIFASGLSYNANHPSNYPGNPFHPSSYPGNPFHPIGATVICGLCHFRRRVFYCEDCITKGNVVSSFWLMTPSKMGRINKRACMSSQVHICAKEYGQLITAWMCATLSK